MKTLRILDTGVANIASILAAFGRLGMSPELSRSPEEILNAEYAVLPGVGAFGAGMETLRRAELDAPFKKRIQQERPTLAVCLGLQMLCEQSEESPGVEGLGVFSQEVRRFPTGVRIPHFGWNQVDASNDCAILSSGYAYFANSYHLTDIPAGWDGATSVHGHSFVAAVEKGPVLACQFHPELSGEWGMHLLERWKKEGAAC